MTSQFHFRGYHSIAFFLENLFQGSQALKTPRGCSFHPPEFRPELSYPPIGDHIHHQGHLPLQGVGGSGGALYECCANAGTQTSKQILKCRGISTQRQQSTQKLCSSLHDSSDLRNAHRGIEAPTHKQNTSTLICCVPMLLMSITISLNVPTPGGHAL